MFTSLTGSEDELKKLAKRSRSTSVVLKPLLSDPDFVYDLSYSRCFHGDRLRYLFQIERLQSAAEANVAIERNALHAVKVGVAEPMHSQLHPLTQIKFGVVGNCWQILGWGDGCTHGIKGTLVAKDSETFR